MCFMNHILRKMNLLKATRKARQLSNFIHNIWTGMSGPTAHCNTAAHSSNAGDLLHSDDVELLHILSKAVDEFGLEWASPALPAKSHLDEWFLQSDHSRKDTPRRPGLPLTN